MSTILEQIKSTVDGLSASERAELAQYLLHSLKPRDHQYAAQVEWLAVAESRMADVRAGQVRGIPAEEVLRDLLEPGS